jgi:hypothetical protein
MRLSEESLGVLARLKEEEVDDGGLPQDETYLRVLIDKLAHLPSVLRPTEDLVDEGSCGLLALLRCERAGLVGSIHQPHHALWLIVHVDLQEFVDPALSNSSLTLVLMFVPMSSLWPKARQR